MEIKLRDVQYKLGKNTILKDIDIDILDGIHGILGKTGSGKTKLLEAISGDINVSGYVTKSYNKLSIVKSENIFLEYTVERELEKVLSDNKILDKSMILRSLKMVGLNKFYLNKNPNDLSFSEKRLLNLSKVLILTPKILLIDDITMGLDRINKKHILNLLKELNKKYNVTIIIASNDIDFINLIATNLIVLEHGRVIAKGLKEDIFKKDNLLNKKGIGVPKILEFINEVEDKKKIKLGIYDDVKDLIKAVYRNV